MYPRLIHIYGPIWIQSYGVMIALGFLLFIYLTYKHPYRFEIIPSNLYFNMLFLGLISGVIGGRLFFLFSDWESFSNSLLEIFYPWVGGFGVLGTIISVLVTISIYLKINKIPILPVSDLLSIYAPLFQSISRIGCFLAGCCYGKVADPALKWSIVFTNTKCLAPLNVPLHPTQLYSSLASFLIFLIMYFRAKFRFKSGQLLFTYLMLESISRFIMDFWRGQLDYINICFFLKPFLGLLSYSQLIALCLFIFSFFGFIYVSKKKSFVKIN